MKKLLIILVVIVVIFAATKAFAWSEPGQSPPNGNVAAPLRLPLSSLDVSGVIRNISESGYGPVELKSWGLFNPSNSIYLEPAPGATLYIVPHDWSTNLTTFIKGSLCLNEDCRTSWPASAASQWTTSGSNIYYNTGNVGIGVSNPTVPLDVNGYIRTTGSLQVNGTGWFLDKIGIKTSSPSYDLDVNGDFAFRGAGYAYNTPLYFYESSTNKYLAAYTAGGKGKIWMTDNSSPLLLQPDGGSVGIGTANPGTKLDVAGSVKGYIYYDDDTNYYADFNSTTRLNNLNVVGTANTNRISRLSGTANITYDSAGDEHVITGGPIRLTNTGTNNWGDVVITGRVISGSDNLHLSPPNGKAVIIDTNYRQAGGATGGVASLVVSGSITATGAIVSTDGSLTAGGLNVTGQAHADTLWYVNSTPAGSTSLCRTSTGNFRVGHCSSLRQYKKNVKDLSLGLSDLLKLKPVEFDWKDMNMGGHDLGFIAEEVEAVDPVLAEYTDGKLSGVKYSQMSALLVKAMQELKAENDELRTRIERLEAKIK